MHAASTTSPASMRQFFMSGATRSYRFRQTQLLQLKKAVQQYESRILEALYLDLHKSAEEAFATEIGIVYAELNEAIQHLEQWMQERYVSSSLALFPSSGKIVRDPLGVCCIIAPWNYPFQLLLSPLTGCIAGGNCAIIKPAELAPHTAAVVAALIRETFPANYIDVLEGEGKEVIPPLLHSFRFDHIFFTGGIAAGKAIALQAAAQLVPVTLELGGKSPCIVDSNANIPVAASRITWGKFTNAGQTCIAPDYVLVHENNKAPLITAIQEAITRFYGADPGHSPDYGRIISGQRFNALCSYLQQGTIITGGTTIAAERYIAPTLLEITNPDLPVMQEEIFGPILPIITYRTHDEAIAWIQRHPHPLALYVFSNSKQVQSSYMALGFGGGCINHTLLHAGNMQLPFGGVGSSGTGQYHGRFSFDTFTRPKAILKAGTWIDPAIKYPPYKGKLKWLRWFFP